MKKKIYAWEPWFMMFFGLFHLHRIWALVDRESYASFWLGIMRNKGAAYFIIMGVLAGLCVLGIVTFVRNRGRNYLWRWIYIFGGGYLLFDLAAIATGMKYWDALLMRMFDTASPYWNVIWSFFIVLGGCVFALGVSLMRKRAAQKNGILDEWE